MEGFFIVPAREKISLLPAKPLLSILAAYIHTATITGHVIWLRAENKIT